MNLFVILGCMAHSMAVTLCNALTATAGHPPLRCSVIDLEQLDTQAEAAQADILLLECEAADVLHRLSRVRHASPRTRVLLMLAQPPTQEWVAQAIELGASGYVVAPYDIALLAKAVRKVHAGDPWFGRSVLHGALYSRLLAASAESREPPPSPTPEGLTPREQQILTFISKGLSNKEIGRHLDISDKTVKTHLHRVYVKLNQSGRYKALLVQPGPGAQQLAWTALPASQRSGAADAGAAAPDAIPDASRPSDAVVPITFTSTRLIPRP